MAKRRRRLTPACKGHKGKRRFHDHQQATRALHAAANYSDREVIPVRAYRCEYCKGWFLTSQPQR